MSSRRVANLVRIRDVQERVARAEVGRAQLDHRRAQAAETAVWQQLEDTASRFALVGSGASLQMANMHVQAGVSITRIRRAAADSAALHVDHRMGEWGLAARQLEAVERLHERVVEREVHDLTHRETTELEDLTIVRHVRAKDGRK